MKEKIIPNTQKRYSITSGGIIYTHYKNTNTGRKCYRKVPLAKYLQKNSAVVNLQFGKHSKSNRSKTIYVNTLMIDMFKLKKPDIFHMYDLKPKNGDILDNSLDNLEWRIRSTSDFNFYPQPYYDKKGNITSKRCSNCGQIKDISYYSLQTPKRKSENPTYKNKCTRCRTTERRILINSSEESLKRAREHARRWSNSEKGKAIINNPHVCLSFFWPTVERQIIIKGIAEKTAENISDNYFASRPDGSKLGAIVSPQSEVIPNREFLEANLKELEKEWEGKEILRPEHWGGFLVRPVEVEFWQGRPNRLHDRIRYQLTDNYDWKIERLSP